MNTKTKEYTEKIAKLREKRKSSSTDLQFVINERDKATFYPLIIILFLFSPISLLGSYLDDDSTLHNSTIILFSLFVIGLFLSITVLIIFVRRIKILTDIRDYLLSSKVLNIKEMKY